MLACKQRVTEACSSWRSCEDCSGSSGSTCSAGLLTPSNPVMQSSERGAKNRSYCVATVLGSSNDKGSQRSVCHHVPPVFAPDSAYSSLGAHCVQAQLKMHVLLYPLPQLLLLHCMKQLQPSQTVCQQDICGSVCNCTIRCTALICRSRTIHPL
jgi:hypothetical protein